MKKRLSACMCVAAMLLLPAIKPARAQTRAGIQAGVNFSNISAKGESGARADSRAVTGFRAGLAADIPLGANLWFQPGVFYAQKGFKQETGGYAGLANNFQVHLSYVEVPVHLLYKPALGPGKLLLGAGPYLAYGTGGTWKSDNVILLGDIVTDSEGKTIFKDDYADGSFGDYLFGKPLDWGASFLVGYELSSRFSLQSNTQLGLANLEPETGGTDRGGSLYNRSYGVTAGFKF